MLVRLGNGIHIDTSDISAVEYFTSRNGVIGSWNVCQVSLKCGFRREFCSPYAEGVMDLLEKIGVVSHYWREDIQERFDYCLPPGPVSEAKTLQDYRSECAAALAANQMVPSHPRFTLNQNP